MNFVNNSYVSWKRILFDLGKSRAMPRKAFFQFENDP